MELSEEQRFVQQTTRDFADNEIAPVALEYERAGEYPRDLVREAAKLGLTAVTLPAEYGGGGFDLTTQMLVTEALHAADPGIAESIVASTFGCEVIAAHGSEGQCERYVEPATQGELVTATAMTEPRGGSDFANVESTAERDGSGFVLNGDKVFITNGSVADVYVVYARTSDPPKPHRGISAFVVEADQPGVDRVRMDGYLGPDTVDMGQVFFDDVELSEDAVIGEVDEGFYYAMETMNESRLEVAGSCLGASRGALDRTIAYVKDREVFDRKVAEYQTIRHAIADLETEIAAVRAFLYETAQELSEGDLQGGRKPAMVKLRASELVEEVTSTAIQFHGGYGVFDEYRVESFFRWSKATQIYDGTSEIMREVIADETLGE